RQWGGGLLALEEGSCVLVPCTLSYPDNVAANDGIVAIWYKDYNNQKTLVYHSAAQEVDAHFRGRAQLLGDPAARNCTLLLRGVTPEDSGPYRFRFEIVNGDRWSAARDVMLRVSGGYGGEITLLKEGQPVASSPTAGGDHPRQSSRISPAPNALRLELREASEEDEGEYECRARNLLGSTHASLPLRVQGESSFAAGWGDEGLLAGQVGVGMEGYGPKKSPSWRTATGRWASCCARPIATQLPPSPCTTVATSWPPAWPQPPCQGSAPPPPTTPSGWSSGPWGRRIRGSTRVSPATPWATPRPAPTSMCTVSGGVPPPWGAVLGALRGIVAER
uniref:Sialic acid binding Ig like lectin 1 n=1 Tax=Calidris pygmaea TaxID=425635 RepID=A0A8C3KSE1_9CHAR